MSVDDELIDRFLDGEVSKDESAAVIEWLESSANLQHFARRAELHSDLRSSLRRRSIQESAMEICDGNETAAARPLSGQADGAETASLGAYGWVRGARNSGKSVDRLRDVAGRTAARFIARATCKRR